MFIVTNYWASFPKIWTASTGLSGTSVSQASSLWDCLKYCRRQDALFLINCAPGLVYQLASVFTAFPAWRRPLISVDLVLRRPSRVQDHLAHGLKRFLLDRVDHHILFHKDVSGYQSCYGISPERCSFVPFKVSLPVSGSTPVSPDGEYVLCYGRSQRDWETFFEAMRHVPYPAATSPLSLPKRLIGQLPKNVRLIEDENTQEAQIRILSRAKLVVLPILKTNIAASGLSVCFNAMGLGKCVIGSEGPAFTGMFSNDEMLLVPPGDPVALAQTIRRAWEGDEFRHATAMRAHRHVMQTGGRDALYQRIIDAVGRWHQRRSEGYVSQAAGTGTAGEMG